MAKWWRGLGPVQAAKGRSCNSLSEHYVTATKKFCQGGFSLHLVIPICTATGAGKMARLALLALLSSLCLALARAYSANEAVPLTLAAGACTGLEIDGLGQKFSYTAIFDSVSLGSGCNQSSIRCAAGPPRP